MLEETTEQAYTTALLTGETWKDFVALVEANNGVWGGCWCMGFHPEGLDRTSARHNREKQTPPCATGNGSSSPCL